MTEGDPPLTQPWEEVGQEEAGNGATSMRALEFQTKRIIQQATELQTELGRREQGEPNRLIHRVIRLHQSTGDLQLDVGAYVLQQNPHHPRQHAPNIRRGAPVQQNPADAHTNLTVTTDNGGRAAPLQDQVMGAIGENEDFIGIHEGNEGPSESTSQGGAMTNMAPIAGPSVSCHTPAPEDSLNTLDIQGATEPPAVGPTSAPEDILVAPDHDIQGATEPPAVHPTPAPKANPLSKPLTPSPEPRQPPSSMQPPPPPQPAAYPLLPNDFIPRRREAEPQARGMQHQQPPQSWSPTNSARAPSSADQLHVMPPSTVVPDSGPKAFIHLKGEHYPRLQAEEPD